MSNDVLRRRLRRQHLAVRATASPLRVVADLAGLHAQLASSAELSLWARMDALEPGAVDRLLWGDRTLVRTWAMRGTLHLLPAADLAVFVAAQQRLKPRHHGGAWLRHHGLTRDEAEAMLAAIPEALDGPPLTRAELAAEVARRTGQGALAEKLAGGFGDLLKPAAFRGDLCFAPPDGPRVRFTRPDLWLGPQEPVAAETGAAAVTRRWLAAYGPGTREHLARWFGMTSPAEAGRWLRSLGDEAVEVDVEGGSQWLLREDAAAGGGAGAGGGARVRLLPAFDPYVVAAPRDSAAVLAPEQRGAVHRPQGWISPVLLVDGRIAGTWRHEHGGGRVAVRIALFAPVPRPVHRAAAEEAERLAAFLGGTLDLGWDG